ncbi:MAG TPA: hypothetical protein VN704_12945 [Verrucomicrobiae bacterium]|nr:hypothetical protein [Verrucomicrobiae bacterium]
MRDKWHIKNNKKGYLKIHVAVNVKTKNKCQDQENPLYENN